MKESYAQMRKFNTWNISIVQQYSRFKESRIRSAVFGNSRQFFIMKQNDRADLDDMSRDIDLPEVTKQNIMGYPLPDQQAGQKFSAFTYYHTDAQRPICGTVHNVASPEMLYCSSTSGEHFEKRARELKPHDNIIEGYATGFDKGRSDAVKQQYWVMINQQKAAEGHEFDEPISLFDIPVPEQQIDGVILKPTTKTLRIEE